MDSSNGSPTADYRKPYAPMGPGAVPGNTVIQKLKRRDGPLAHIPCHRAPLALSPLKYEMYHLGVLNARDGKRLYES